MSNFWFFPFPAFRISYFPYNIAMSEEVQHVPVLSRQVLELFDPKPGQVLLDCTIGQGGHAAQIAAALGPGGRCIGLDVDPASLRAAAGRLADLPVDLHLVRGNFASAPEILADLGFQSVDLLLADLGFSTPQLVNASRGLSFSVDGPLDMRLDPELSGTAADLVNHLPADKLADLLFRFGQERLSRKIARKIVEIRKESPIQTTEALARLVRRAYGPKGRRSRIDPATRTFMALRIAVNDELGALQRLLDNLERLLGQGGAAVIISFHSLEDRLVKQAFRKLSRTGQNRLLTPKPITADPNERSANPASRSAKLRAVRFEMS